MEHDNKIIDPDGFLLVNDDWVHPGFTGKVKWQDGPKYWFKNGQRHREDGPAVEYKNGNTEWWYKGKEGLDNFPKEIKKKLTRIFLHGT